MVCRVAPSLLGFGMGGTPANCLLWCRPRGARIAVLFSSEVKHRGGLVRVVAASGTLGACTAVIIIVVVFGLWGLLVKAASVGALIITGWEFGGVGSLGPAIGAVGDP